MRSVMFICYGNICRSPMAEMIFKELLRQCGRENEVTVSSCATGREEIWGGRGSPVYPPAQRELERHGIPCEERQAVQLTREDYERYELFVCMDSSNLRDAARIFGGDPEGKLRLLMQFTAHGGDVADPWYSDRFDIAYRDITNGCRALLEQLIKETE